MKVPVSVVALQRGTMYRPFNGNTILFSKVCRETMCDGDPRLVAYLVREVGDDSPSKYGVSTSFAALTLCPQTLAVPSMRSMYTMSDDLVPLAPVIPRKVQIMCRPQLAR